MRAGGQVVGIAGGGGDVKVAVTQAVIVHDVFLVDAQGAQYQCGGDAGAALAGGAVDDCGIVVLVQQDVEHPAEGRGVGGYNMAVDALHDAVDRVAPYALFVYAGQDVGQVSGGDGDVHHVRWSGQRGGRVGAFGGIAQVDDGAYAQVVQLVHRGGLRRVNLG